MQAKQLLNEEMLALGKADLPRLLELLEVKRTWLQELSARPDQLDAAEVLGLWRQNRQILRACNLVCPAHSGYARRGRP